MTLTCQTCKKQYDLKEDSYKMSLRRRSAHYCSLDCRYGTPEERFQKSFVNNETTGCWEWTSHFRSNGYGFLKIGGKSISAHRFSYEHYKEAIYDSLLVCHTCDNRKCVNPEHLFLGTHSDNMKDAFAKGRLTIPKGSQFKKGQAPVNQKLSLELVRQIKALILNKELLKDIAQQYNVKETVIRDISAGRTYKNI